MICPICQRDVAKLFLDGEDELCVWCQYAKDPERRRMTSFPERVVKVKGFGWVTRQQQNEWQRKGGWLDRVVDPRTGDVKTYPLRHDLATRKIFPMGA